MRGSAVGRKQPPGKPTYERLVSTRKQPVAQVYTQRLLLTQSGRTLKL